MVIDSLLVRFLTQISLDEVRGKETKETNTKDS